MPMIETINLTKKYGELVALNNLNLSIEQGACFGFREGFASGVHRMAWGNDGSMFVGLTDRGWGSTGPKRHGLQRVVYAPRKHAPFEMKEIRAFHEGFEIEFTDTVMEGAASDVSSYQIFSFGYNYHPQYGSPEVDTTGHSIRAITRVNPKTYRLFVNNLKPERVYEIDTSKVLVKRSPLGPPLHPTAYYTLQVIPEAK